MESTAIAQPKRKRGRPSKLETIDLKEVERLAGLGFIEEEIASILKVTRQTLANWKSNPEFLYALNEGKRKTDEQVTVSLFKRATGYDHEDIYFSSYQGDVTATPYIKHWAPDVTAQIFWLKNRRREDWRDNPELTHMSNADKVAREFAKMVSAASTGYPTSGGDKVQDGAGEVQDEPRGEEELQD